MLCLGLCPGVFGPVKGLFPFVYRFGMNCFRWPKAVRSLRRMDIQALIVFFSFHFVEIKIIK